MTLDEANQRIALSRKTLVNYAETLAGHQLASADLGFVTDEINALETVARIHPGKTDVVLALVTAWVRLRERIIGKVH